MNFAFQSILDVIAHGYSLLKTYASPYYTLSETLQQTWRNNVDVYVKAANEFIHQFDVQHDEALDIIERIVRSLKNQRIQGISSFDDHLSTRLTEMFLSKTTNV